MYLQNLIYKFVYIMYSLLLQFYSTLSKIHASNLVTSVKSVLPALEAATWPQAPEEAVHTKQGEPGVGTTKNPKKEHRKLWEFER